MDLRKMEKLCIKKRLQRRKKILEKKYSLNNNILMFFLTSYLQMLGEVSAYAHSRTTRLILGCNSMQQNLD